MRILLFLFAIFVTLAAARLPAAGAETVSVAAASDLEFCLEELDAAFAKGHSEALVQATTGSSGNFFAQIRNGAPIDVFLSADLDYPRKLAEAGFADKASFTPYATGRVVLWTMKADLDVKRGLQLLSEKAVRKVAIANPEHAPYGRAAKAALVHEGLWEGLQPKIVLGENIAQTVQFVQSGNADAGLVARSLVLSPKLAGQGHLYEVPEAFHPRIEQAGILTKQGAAKPGAKAYLEFLRGPEARAILARYGFGPPAEK